MKRFFPVTVLLAAAVLTSCSFDSSSPSTEQSSSSVGSESDLATTGSTVITPTRNVSYIGTVGELGVSIYQQGTHKLVLDDGQFILLESTDANLSLNVYLEKRVEVRGSVQPTVEGNGEIMRVEEVTVLESAASASFSSLSSSVPSERAMCGGIAGLPCSQGFLCVDDSTDSCDPMAGGADCSGVCVRQLESSSSSKALSVSSKSVASVAAPASSSTASSLGSSEQSSESSINSLESQIVLMAKQKYGEPALWTQKYCSSHTGFCIPAHKNWYFKSFGATTSNAWHVEFGMTSIDALRSGPIVLNLVSGSSESMDAVDGQVKMQGRDVVGFKDWTGGMHFELIGDARLKEAISFMLQSITPYSTGE